MITLPSSEALEIAANQARTRVIAIAAGRADGWESGALSLGTSEDKIASLRFSGVINRLTDPVLEAMFTCEVFSHNGVVIYPETAFSEGVKFKGTAADVDAQRWLDERWRVPEVCTEGAIWGRLYGGCVTWIVTDRDVETLQAPLEPEETVTALRHVERPYVTPISDPDTFDEAGFPQWYRISPPQGGTSTVVHISRIVIWPGALTPQRLRIQLGYWDYSVLQRPYDVLKRNGYVSTAAAQLLSEASIGIFGIKDLYQAIASGNQTEIARRIRAFNATRNNARAIFYDKDREQFTRVNGTFAGVGEITDRARQEVAAAFGVPVTLLLGESPAGLNATGDSDVQNFYKHVSSYQKHQVEPCVHKLALALLQSAESPVRVSKSGLSIMWPDLWAPTAKESAEIYAATAGADVALVQAEIITPEQSRSRFTTEGYSQDLDLTPDDVEDPLEDGDLLGTSEGGNTPDETAGQDATTETPAAVLNGAQVQALVSVVSDVATGKIPRDSAVQIIAMSYQVSAEQAELVLGSAGKGFKPTSDEPLPVAAPAPATPANPPGLRADSSEEPCARLDAAGDQIAPRDDMAMAADPGVKEPHDPMKAAGVIQTGLRMLSGHDVSVGVSMPKMDQAENTLNTSAGNSRATFNTSQGTEKPPEKSDP